MNKVVFVILVVIASVLAIYFSGMIVYTGMFVGFRQAEVGSEWWNASWTYRYKLEFNSTSFSRDNWLVERETNFTDLLPSGTFDPDSVRVVEYYSNGTVERELPSQFDQADGYDATDNALGTLVFIVNGTMGANELRTFFVYYDSVDNGPKAEANYQTNLVYGWNGEEFSVNNSILPIHVDTLRGQNTSGLIKVKDIFLWPLGSGDKTYEYSEYSNQTHKLGFDFRYNATLIYNGSVRMVVEQRGNETLWNTQNVTNEGYMVKRYTFYNHLSWIKIETDFTNIAPYPITRNSTFAGAVAIDASRAFGGSWESTYGNTTPPGWWFASDQFSTFHSGIVHINQTGTDNFTVPNSSGTNRIGVQLNDTLIASGASITQTALVHFNDTFGNPNQVRDFRNRFETLPEITQYLPEKKYVVVYPTVNATFYNRNESILIFGNVSTDDPYNLTSFINATLDMGTASTADDQTITLYDDGAHGDIVQGDKNFTNIFNLSDTATFGNWTINLTAYTSGDELLNFSIVYANVTDVYNLSIVLTDDRPITGTVVIANLYVRNYRQDAWIDGATINCSYSAGQIENKTSFNNGTYTVNFTAPIQEGDYVLSCNATRNGNLGVNTAGFSAESLTTALSITPTPSQTDAYNVTKFWNETFELTINTTNRKNGTAYTTNLSVELLAGWSNSPAVVQCGDVNKADSCWGGTNVTIPNATSPGNYSINATVTWRNPDGSITTNRTSVNITVHSNPKVDVRDLLLIGIGGDGASMVVANFTVLSVGNDDLGDIDFNCTSGAACTDFSVSFLPANLTSLALGSHENISINASIPFEYSPGNYTGDINVSSNSSYVNFTFQLVVASYTNVAVVTDIQDYSADNVTMMDNETFVFLANATDAGNASARYVNISLGLPTGWGANYSLENCPNLTKDEFCEDGFNVSVPNGTMAGTYYVYVNANWTNPDNSFGTNYTTVNVTVGSNPVLDVFEDNVTGYASDGVESGVGSFTILSVGNDELQIVTFSCIEGEVCQNFTLQFVPNFVNNISVNLNASVDVDVTVPVGYPAGTYNGTVNVSALNGNYDNFTLEVIVLENRTWSVSPQYCQRSYQVPVGTVCSVNVTNDGNTEINFTVSPSQGNYTTLSENNFSVNFSDWHTFSINYNATGASGIHNSTFTVDAVQADASPDSVNVMAVLLPFDAPTINLSIIPNKTGENNTVSIFANVTDNSGSGLSFVRVNVSAPNANYSLDMFQYGTDGNATLWQLNFPNATNGSTLYRGLYNMTLYTQDNVGNLGIETKSLLIHQNLGISISTLSSIYYQGDTASVYYTTRNLTGSPIFNVTVNFTIESSLGNVTYVSGNYQTNTEGTISPFPTFETYSDTPIGNYTLNSYSTYYDDVIERNVEVQENASFRILSRSISVSGLFADIETAVVWYPNSVMRFGILVYNAEGQPVDPTSIGLIVYDPADNVYFSTTDSSMTKEAVGYYTYQYAMPASTASGMYLAALNVTQDIYETMKLKAFRVSQGGPYDVRIDLLENEVGQGEYLDFNLVVENKGVVTQDVFVEYWVSSETDTYYTESEAILTPALSNQTFTRNAYIYSDQPLGNYLLNARVTYSSVQPAILVNKSFTVVASPLTTTTTTPPAAPPSYVFGGTGAFPLPIPTEEVRADILITKYNNNITIARGFVGMESVTVNNTGDSYLTDVSLYMLGIPANWFNITPTVFPYMVAGNSTTFVINFDIPRNAEEGIHLGSLIASSGVVSDQKKVTINVYEKLEYVIRDELKKLRDELEDLRVETILAQREGKDTTNVFLIIDEIRREISLAEDNLDEGKTDEALDNVGNAKNLMEQAWDLLERLEVITVRGFEFPLWAIIVILASIIASAFLVVFFIIRRRRKGEKGLVFKPWIDYIKNLPGRLKKKKVSREVGIKEKDRLLRMLKVLEKERKEKIISEKAYKDMKDSIEKKLSRIEEDMKS